MGWVGGCGGATLPASRLTPPPPCLARTPLRRGPQGEGGGRGAEGGGGGVCPLGALREARLQKDLPGAGRPSLTLRSIFRTRLVVRCWSAGRRELRLREEHSATGLRGGGLPAARTASCSSRKAPPPPPQSSSSRARSAEIQPRSSLEIQPRSAEIQLRFPLRTILAASGARQSASQTSAEAKRRPETHTPRSPVVHAAEAVESL